MRPKFCRGRAQSVALISERSGAKPIRRRRTRTSALELAEVEAAPERAADADRGAGFEPVQVAGDARQRRTQISKVPLWVGGEVMEIGASPAPKSGDADELARRVAQVASARQAQGEQHLFFVSLRVATTSAISGV